MEFIESERGNQKLNIKLEKNLWGAIILGLLSCSHFFILYFHCILKREIKIVLHFWKFDSSVLFVFSWHSESCLSLTLIK